MYFYCFHCFRNSLRNCKIQSVNCNPNYKSNQFIKRLMTSNICKTSYVGAALSIFITLQWPFFYVNYSEMETDFLCDYLREVCPFTIILPSRERGFWWIYVSICNKNFLYFYLDVDFPVSLLLITVFCDYVLYVKSLYMYYVS